jgi:hypothetical protein
MARTLVNRWDARVWGEAPATPPEQPQGLAGVCEVGVGVFLAEWLGIGDPLPLIAFKLANATAAEPLTLDATRPNAP